jgi:ectoine hydroxylase-related dioxygenase (phytanoyl-CoA dioxygenase family)
MQKINLNKVLINLKKNYYSNGYVHLKKIFSKKQVNSLKNNILEFKKKKKIQYTKILHLDRYLKDVKKFISQEHLLMLLKYILNYKEILGLQTEVFFNPPGTAGYGFHQDDFFLGSGKNNSANLWIPLVKTNKKNGTLKFLNNSHNLGVLKKVNQKNLSNTKNIKKNGEKHICCEIGDAILISNHVFHGSGVNRSSYNRYVLAVGYINKGAKYRKGFTAKRKSFILN